MTPAATRHLVIFTRYPQLGAGKRRLAAGIGAVGAVRFQRVRLAILLHRLARDRRWTTWLAVTPEKSGPWPPHVGVINQGRGDLGQRLERVVGQLPPGRALIVGSDIPGITARHVARAFNALAGHDAVFGPAGDGGYWLVGLHRGVRKPRPFANVRWSSSDALADTVANLHHLQIGYAAHLDDVDDAVSLASAPGWSRLISPA